MQEFDLQSSTFLHPAVGGMDLQSSFFSSGEGGGVGRVEKWIRKVQNFLP